MMLTVIALLLGIAAHALKQIIGARRAGTYVSLREYFLQSWAETALAVVCALAMYLAYPEIPVLFPALAAALGIGTTQTAFGAFLCGFVGNSLADILGGRLVRIAGQ
jgi:hypothetical protein